MAAGSLTPIVSTRFRVLSLPWREDVANLFPHAKAFEMRGARWLAVPHGLDETRLLTNLGIAAPAPILTQYDWPAADSMRPFVAQQQTAALLTTEPRAFVLNGFGTGKTRAALWAIDYLLKAGLAHRALVVAPLSTLTFTWSREIMMVLPHLSCAVLHGSAEKRRKLLHEDHDVYIINHDGLKVLEQELRRRQDIDIVVLDEIAVYRNGRADRSKVTRRVIEGRRWVWGMTGAPTPQAPTDAWAQVKMLLPDRLNGKGFVRFREEVMIKAGPFRWVPRRDSAEVVHALMQPSVRYTLEDVAELPELVIQPLPVELGPIQADIYEKLTKHSFAMVESGAIAPMNEAVLIGKLTQVALGWVYTSNRGITHLDPAPRIQAMLDILAGARAKVIVFVPYTHALQGVADEVDKAGFSVAVVDGSVSKAQRDTIFNQFQNTGDPRVIVAHPACMSHGLTLTAADTIIWFGPTDSLETFEQANARITRVGQHRKQLVVLLEGTPVERKAYRRLRDKKAMQGLLLELHAEQTRRSATP